MEKITSNKNEYVKQWNKLKTTKGRKEQKRYLLESWHLVEEALHSNDHAVELVLATEEEYKQHKLDLQDIPVTIVSPEVSKYLASTKTPQGIFALVTLPTALSLDELNNLSGGWILLDNVQDPGNIGTIVRTADAAGMKGVVFGNGTASPYNPKVLRAMQGSQFHLTMIEADLKAVLPYFYKAKFPVYGTQVDKQALNYQKITPQHDFGLIMGNEGNGIAQELINKTTKNLYIPIKGKAESLNVGVAAGVLMFYLNG